MLSSAIVGGNMVKIKEMFKKYRDGKCTVKEQMLIRISIGLFAVLALCILSAVIDFLVWIYPHMESIIFLATISVVIYEGAYILWYLEIWAYGGVKNDLKKYYPYIQNAIYMVVTDIYTALGVMKPLSKSAVASIGQKTFNKGNWVIYQYNLLLSGSGDAIDVEDAKEILQNELIRKSEEGFDGIIFDVNGYPYLQVDSVLVDGSYMQVQIVVLWNEAEKSNYEGEQEQKRTARSNTTMVDDEVF